jgi:hypothetical protein
MGSNRYKIKIVLILFTTCVLLSCNDSSVIENKETVYFDLLNKFDERFPGRGMIDYPGNPSNDNAKSYAMVLNAELNRMNFNSSNLSTLGKNAGDWLINNTLTDEFGNIGWGISSEWDAFGDSTVNPANTIYTISTSIVIEALLNWIEMDTNCNKLQIWNLIDKVTQSYLNKNTISTNGLLPYSCNPNDFGYNCYNPAIHMAGQFQRISQLHPLVQQRKKFADLAFNNINILLKDKIVSSTGNWYWNYSDLEKIPNDMPHALYIINGINTYINYGGKNSALLDNKKVNNHITDFYEKDSLKWHSWPIFRKDLKINPEPRLYDLGYAMAFCSDYFEYYADSLFKLSHRYKNTVSGLYNKYINDTTIINEYQSYLLFGLSKYLYKRDFVASPNNNISIYKSLDKELPFSDLSSKFFDVNYFFDTLSNKSELSVNKNIIKTNNDIPLSFEALNDYGLVFCRKSLSNEIVIYKTEFQQKPITLKLLPKTDISNFVFRKSFVYNEKIWLIVFDFIQRKNFLFSLSLNNNVRFTLDNPIPFDLEEELGYEQQPKISVKIFQDKCFLISANNLFTLEKTRNLTRTKYGKNTELLEIEASTKGIYILGKYIDQAVYSKFNKSLNQYYLFSIEDKTDTVVLEKNKIYYNLRQINNRISLNYISSKNSAYDYLVFQLKRMNNNGVMSFGVDNYEGEVVWTQSYYLTGMNDFLHLSKIESNNDLKIESLNYEFKKRLSYEIKLLYKLIGSSKGISCKTFTVNRSAVLHAVQTGKTLLLLNRIREDSKIYEPAILSTFAFNTTFLRNHIETFGKTGSNYPNNPSYGCLIWHKGSSFKYDGNVIPFNHQNCWASAILFNKNTDELKKKVAKDIVNTLIEIELKNRVEKNSNNYYWNYWWGIAKTGWKLSDSISVNTPSWQGDGERVALARYRTFDAIAVMALANGDTAKSYSNYLNYFTQAVYVGGLELFALPYLLKSKQSIDFKKLDDKVLNNALKFDSQPSLRNTLIAWRIKYSLLK